MNKFVFSVELVHDVLEVGSLKVVLSEILHFFVVCLDVGGLLDGAAALSLGVVKVAARAGADLFVLSAVFLSDPGLDGVRVHCHFKHS